MAAPQALGESRRAVRVGNGSACGLSQSAGTRQMRRRVWSSLRPPGTPGGTPTGEPGSALSSNRVRFSLRPTPQIPQCDIPKRSDPFDGWQPRNGRAYWEFLRRKRTPRRPRTDIVCDTRLVCFRREIGLNSTGEELPGCIPSQSVVFEDVFLLA